MEHKKYSDTIFWDNDVLGEKTFFKRQKVIKRKEKKKIRHG
jgi:hypothetical protein